MASCRLCGGFGRVAAGGTAGQFATMFGAEVHDCPWCSGTGRASPAERVPKQRTEPSRVDLVAMLPGEWLVEIHRFGHLLAVMRFLLVRDGAVRRFEGRCDYGGLPGWTAKGEWSSSEPGDVIRFAGTQSSPYLVTTEYRWGVRLDTRHDAVLHGESVCNEWTVWSRPLEQTFQGAMSELVTVSLRR